MTETVEQLKSSAVALTLPERADLAYFLLTSMKSEDEGTEAAWRVEIARHVAEIRSGNAVGRPVEDVLVELREQYP